MRLETAESYSVLDSLPDVADSVVLHLEDPGTAHGWLGVVVAAGPDAAPDLPGQVRRALREQLSPRHSPDHVRVTPALSRNSNGKRLEVPLKRVVQGAAVGSAVDLGTLTDPEAFAATAELVRLAVGGPNPSEPAEEAVRGASGR